MASRMEHEFVGMTVGVMFATAYSMQVPGLNSPFIVAAVMVGSVGGRFQDILEPPRSPNHRGFYHSVAFLGMLVIIGYLLFASDRIPPWTKYLVAVFLMAAATHLLIDAGTPKGIKLWK